MSDSIYNELVQWRHYAKCPAHEKQTPWGKRCARWQERIRSNPYELSPEEYELLRQSRFPFTAVDARWMDGYLAVVQFQKRHGHCFVPLDRIKSNTLGKWVQTQRYKYKKRELSPRKQRALNGIGFCWDVESYEWQQRLAELKDYIRKHGHMRISKKRSTSQQDRRLANWIGNNRARIQGLSLAQRRQLDLIGFVWKPYSSQWEAALGELKTFVKKHGHADIPHDSKIYPKAAAMLCSQRSLYKEGGIDPVRRKQLEALGVHWNIFDDIWEEHYGELCQFHQRFGHARVPYRWRENKTLERWVRHQRGKWNGLSSERRDRLTALGVRQGRSGKRNGFTLKELILKELEGAGEKGIKVEEIARRVNAKKNIVAAWFHDNAHKMPEIQKLRRGIYAVKQKKRSS